MRFGLLLWAILLTGCEYYSKPNHELPRDFSALTLDGNRLDRDEMKGRPWVIALWVPG